MSKSIVTIFFTIVSIYCKSQGIQFEENRTLKQIFTKAKVENKNVFIDAFATWCGPCKQMDSSVYTSEEVGSFFNSNFINVKIQMDKTGGDNEYIRSLYSQASGIRSKYNISVYPSYLFFNADGKITHREVGFKTAKELIELGRVALDSGRQYYSKIDKFSELPPVEMLELAREIEKVEGKNYAISLTQKYIQATEESLFNPANIRLIYDYTEGTRNKGFTFIKNNLEKIAASDPFLTRDSTYTATVLRWFLYRKISHEEIIPYQSAKNEKTDWEKIKKNVKKFGRLGFEALDSIKPQVIFQFMIQPHLSEGASWNVILPLIKSQKLGKSEEFLIGSSIVYYINAIIQGNEKDLKNFMPAAIYYSNHYAKYLSAKTRNTWGWKVFEKSDNPLELGVALEWVRAGMKQSTEDGNILDTYANLLYKLGRKNEAIRWQEKALRIDPNSTWKLKALEKMKRGEPTWK